LSKYKEKIVLFLISKLGTKILSLLLRSYRVEIIGKEIEDRVRKDYSSFICAFWHQRFLYLLNHFRDCEARVMISYSRDGEMIAKAVEGFGIIPIRGSSSKGRVSSFREVVEVIKNGGSVGIAPDGPKGPAYRVKLGIIQIAKQAGVPIVPVTVGAEKRWCFNSWDRFIVPKPFSRVCVKYGEPIFVEVNSSNEVLELKRKELEERLLALTVEVDARYRNNK